jgi:hypothetical protein
MNHSRQGIHLHFAIHHPNLPIRINLIRFIDLNLIRATRWFIIIPITTMIIAAILVALSSWPILFVTFIFVTIITVTIITIMFVTIITVIFVTIITILLRSLLIILMSLPIIISRWPNHHLQCNNRITLHLLANFTCCSRQWGFRTRLIHISTLTDSNLAVTGLAASWLYLMGGVRCLRSCWVCVWFGRY